MGLGSFLLFINASPWNLTKIASHNYQMEKWNSPGVISPG